MLDRYFSSNQVKTIDGKGRVSMPHSFRKVLDAEPQPGVVLIPGLYGEPCIEGLGYGRYNRVAEAIDRMNPGDPRGRALRNKFFGQSHHLQIEDTGRISLGKDLRDLLGNPADLLFVGMGKTFQIWNPAVYAERQGEMDALAADSFALLPWDPQTEDQP